MDRNLYAAPATALERPTPGTVSMIRYGLLCFLGLLVTLAGVALIRRFLTPDEHLIRAVITALIASAFDVAVAASMVYATVPRMARYFLRQLSPVAGDSPHDGERDRQTH